jgi:hypothetical protein
VDGGESASAPADAAASDAEGDISMALCAALLGTLMLGSIVGVESHWELLALLALIAGLALVLDGAALNWVRRGSPKRGRPVP